jgi:hypothetical protein
MNGAACAAATTRVSTGVVSSEAIDSRISIGLSWPSSSLSD